MSIVRYSCALACLALLSGYASAANPTTFPTDALPRPPEQDKPWTPPKTRLPATLLSATELLFRQGMADPRGGEYRQITLGNDNWLEMAAPLQVHGWVFPATNHGKHLAVCWDGLAYWVDSIGKPADVKTDVAEALAADRTGNENWLEEKVINQPHIGLGAAGLNSLAVPLLLRLGQGALAEEWWNQDNADTAKLRAEWDAILPKTQPASAPQPATQLSPRDMDPYPRWVDDWEGFAYRRAAVLHQQGDDRLSFAVASLLTDSMARARKSMADRHLSPPEASRFLDPLPQLLADEKRRDAEGNVHRVLDYPGEYKDPGKRIAGLIRDLEVSAPDEAGTIDPVVAALEKEGYAAVPALIDCLSNDNRLTRCLTDDGHEEWSYWLFGVRPVAYDAICDILQESQFGPITRGNIGWASDQRDAIAGEVREYWKKYHDLPQAERYYRILADDTAEPEAWEDAGGWITRLTDQQIKGSWTDGPPMLGEALRAKKNPRITDLLIQRAQYLNSTDLALDLLHWDRASAVPTLQLLIDRRKGVTQDSDADGAATLFAALLRTGEPHAGRQYGIWICNQKACDDPVNEQLFRPVWMNPKDHDVAAAAEWLFNNPASPWYCLATMKSNAIIFSPMELLTSPLISAPAFQKSAVRNLQNQAVCHRMAIRNDMVEVVNSNGLGPDGPVDPKLWTKPGETRPVRACDWYAEKLSELQGAPEFELYWPTEQRDAAIKRCIAFVQDWGERFAPSGDESLDGSRGGLPAEISFPHRMRPATDAEAKAHTAIFSLGSDRPTRAVPLPDFPNFAVWKNYTGSCLYSSDIDPKTGKTVWSPQPDQDGEVWQAEERLENGKWKRYYGFVGAHIVAMVSAEEIELVKPDAPATRP